MLLKSLLTAAAMSALMVGAAQAQAVNSASGKTEEPTVSGSVVTDPGPPAASPATTSTITTTDGATTTTSTTDTSAAAATSFGRGASVTTTLTTNGPVADTPENRAKYGQPMSNAGKRTAAKGN